MTHRIRLTLATVITAAFLGAMSVAGLASHPGPAPAATSPVIHVVSHPQAWENEHD